MARLAQADREIIELRYYRELEHAEIAALLGCTLPAARPRLRRALARLRRVLPPADLP